MVEAGDGVEVDPDDQEEALQVGSHYSYSVFIEIGKMKLRPHKINRLFSVQKFSKLNAPARKIISLSNEESQWISLDFWYFLGI